MTDWMEDAACRGTDPEVFFPQRGDDLTPALAICATCPVKSDCLKFALDHNMANGIWGGLSENRRWRLRQTGSTEPVCIICRSPFKSSKKTRKCVACRGVHEPR